MTHPRDRTSHTHTHTQPQNTTTSHSFLFIKTIPQITTMTTEQQRLASLLDRLEKITVRLEGAGSANGSTPSSSSSTTAAATGGDAPQVAAFDEYLNTHLNPFVETMRKIGGDLPHMVR